MLLNCNFWVVILLRRLWEIPFVRNLIANAVIVIRSKRIFIRRIQNAIGLAMVLGSSLSWSQDSTVSKTQDRLKKWVETRQLTSEEAANWLQEKESLQQSIDLFKSESDKLKGEIKEVQDQESNYAQEFSDLEKENESLKTTIQTIATSIGAAEKRVVELKSRLPQPLLEKLEPFLNRIPEDPSKTKLSASERAQTIVGILSEVDKFQSSITVVGELRKNQSGSEIQVQTLYLGLSQAYFVNQQGDFAGTGVPSVSGWDWKIESALAGKIKKLIGIYENTVPAEFLSIPFQASR